MVYQWKTGSHISGDAQVAGDICERLEKEGRLSAKALLDVSRPQNAPLHSNFEWNDGVAAEKYRENQAREIIRSLVIIPEQNAPVRSFFKIENTGNTYQSVKTILQSEDLTTKLLKTALRELNALHQKYYAVQNLEKVWAALSEVEKEALL